MSIRHFVSAANAGAVHALARNPGENELHQAVKEVSDCLGPALESY